MNDWNNSYKDEAYARAYSHLAFPGCYHLAYRELPSLIAQYASGSKALDFGCGTGRSTRFLYEQGYQTIGIDISEGMIAEAQKNDLTGDYHLVQDGDFSPFEPASFDLILSVFTFDNIPNEQHRIDLLTGLKDLLKPNGTMILVDATPELYQNETTSFSTKNFPENRGAKSGDKVKVIIKDIQDSRPVEDFLWFHEDYLHQSTKAGLKLLESRKTFGKDDEPYEWISEKEVAPWIVYALKKVID